MLLSELLKKNTLETEYQIFKEREFETLALVGELLEKKFCTFIDDEKYIKNISPSVAMVITTEKIKSVLEKDREIGFCIVDHPRLLYFKLHNFLSNDKRYIREDFDTKIGEGCTISSLSSIAKKNVVIGKNVRVEEFVVIREGTVVGDGSILYAGSVIGGCGFEVKREDEHLLPVKHLGGVVIGKEVEIRHNSVIDRAVYPWDDTVIGDYSKIDSLVEIAHGVKIGKAVMVIATAAIFGRTVIHDKCRIGPGAVIRNAIDIGSKANVNLGSVVTKNIEEAESVTGNFAVEHGIYMKIFKDLYAKAKNKEKDLE